MPRPTEEQVKIVADLDEHDVEDIQRWLAYRMMPRWGQVLAWLVWELPWLWFIAILFIVATISGAWSRFAWTLPWQLAIGAALLPALVMTHARRHVKNPFRTYVFVTRRSVPAEPS